MPRKLTPWSVLESENPEHAELRVAAVNGDFLARAELLARDLSRFVEGAKDLSSFPARTRSEKAFLFDLEAVEVAVRQMWPVWLEAVGGEALYWLVRIEHAAKSKERFPRLYFGTAESDAERTEKMQRAIRGWREARPGAKKSGEIRPRFVEAAAFLKTVGITAKAHELETIWKAHEKRQRRRKQKP